jgi:hypothetical protein
MLVTFSYGLLRLELFNARSIILENVTQHSVGVLAKEWRSTSYLSVTERTVRPPAQHMLY